MAPCQRFAQNLSDYADNELDKNSKGKLETHLEQCPDCARYLKHLKALKTYLRELSPIKTTKDFVPVLRDRLRQFQQEKVKPERRFTFSGQRLVPILGVGAISVIIAFLLVDHTPVSSDNVTGLAVEESRSPATSGPREPVHESSRFRPAHAEESPGFVAGFSEADTLVRTDSTSHSKELDAVRSRIRTVSH